MRPRAARRTPEPCGACEQERLKAELAEAAATAAQAREREKAEAAALVALHQAERDAEHELAKLFHTTVAEVAKGALDRSRDSAKYVQTAAAAIGTLYSALLALVFSVTDHPLPVRGVWAAVFLGLSVALATAYLAFLTKPVRPPMYGGGNSLADLQFQRTGWLTKFVNSTVLNRRWAIRASVLALAFGVAFVPAAFVATTRLPDAPPAPAAPEIPAEVAAAVEADAARLFAARVADYEAATAARAAALAEQAKAVRTLRADEERVNDRVLLLALAALAITVGWPGLLGEADKRRERQVADPAFEASPAVAARGPAAPGAAASG